MTEPTTVSEVLDAAAVRLETHGWRRRMMCRRERCCVLGAIIAVTPPFLGDLAIEAIGWLALAINEPDIATWNDSQASAKPVIAALRAAARLADTGTHA